MDGYKNDIEQSRESISIEKKFTKKVKWYKKRKPKNIL